MRRTNRLLLLALLLLTPLLACAQMKQSTESQLRVTESLELFKQALLQANQFYVDTVDVEHITQRAIDAMLSQLDPYTVYMPEVESEDFAFMTTGEYGGIGAYIQLVDSIVYIQQPMPGSPAEKAGLQMGDYFIEIDGESVIPGTPATVSSKLRGPIGTVVKGKVQKIGQAEPTEVALTRANVTVDQVVHSTLYNDSIGYIRLGSFTDKSYQDVRNAFLRLNQEGKMKRLILDLRSNGGGVMGPAIDILGLFVPKGTKVLYTQGRQPTTSQEYYTEEEPIAPNMPLAVLINEGSASASEIVAGALQDLDRAVLLGEKSFGKGLVQTTLKMPQEGLLKITISRYYIPSGRCIQQLDYSHRNPDGSVAAVPDSLTHTFKTKNGRLVRDGGGIRPDITIQDESLSSLLFQISNRGQLFAFSNKLYIERPTPKSLAEVTITDEDFEQFITFLEEKGYKPEQYTLKAVGELERLAEFEGYEEQTKEAFEELKQALQPNLRRELSNHKVQTKRLLRSLLAQHYFGSSGQYQILMEDDPTTLRAIQLLQDDHNYRAILSGTTTKEVGK